MTAANNMYASFKYLLFLTPRNIAHTLALAATLSEQMRKGYSIKADNKPTLFTWDLETEYQNVDRQLKSELTKNEGLGEVKRTQLRELKRDFHNIVLAKEINPDQVERIFNLVRHGKSGVWETATTAIEKLGFHFELIKSRLLTELTDSDPRYVANLVTAIGEFYERGQLTETLKGLLENKNKKVKERTLNRIFELRLSELKDELMKLKKTENKKEVIDQIDFTIKYVDTPKGNLIISR